MKYKNQLLACAYKADFICFETILVELKAIEPLGNSEKSQVLNYLNATKLKRALLFNFGSPSLEHQRSILGYESINPAALSEINLQSGKNLRTSA